MVGQRKILRDKVFLAIVIALTLFGYLIFLSASLGLLTRSSASFELVALKQLGIIVLGALAFIVASRIPYKHLRRYSLYIYIVALFITILVFVPYLGFTHGGARRWLSFGPLTFQPSEFLKAAFVIYVAAWLSSGRRQVTSFKKGIIPMMAILGSTGLVLILQPNTSTLIIIFLTAFGMMIMAGARMVHLGAVVLVASLLFGSLVVARPYVRDRITTFIDPTSNPLTSSYQIQQSLIAIGSGGWLGRGFGQSVQKFDYLPEAVGDSIFAVVAEEFGFVGSTALIALFIGFAWRGFRISARSPNNFTRLLSGGFVILIISESFINISSMLGVIPLTGTPLLFVSHGGSAMLFALAESGVIYGISRYSLISKS